MEKDKTTMASTGKGSSQTEDRNNTNDDVRDRVSTAPSEVCRVGVKIPPFWPQKPALWFAQVEGQFILSGIKSDDTKFYSVTSQLDEQYASAVEDLIRSPPATGKYEKLKTELIGRLSASYEKKVQQLLMHEELGDRKPSQFLRHLQNLAGENLPNEFLKTIWTGRMPQNIQTVIASQPRATLEDLADLADRVFDITSPYAGVASTSTSAAAAVGQPPASAWNDMVMQISELTRQVKKLTTERFQNRSRSRSRSNQQNRTRSSSNSSRRNSKYPTCWYHYKFGPKANKCLKPCNFTESENYQGGR